MPDVDKAIASAVKTGKVVLGAREAVRSLKNGKARLVVLTSDSPPQIREDLEYYGRLSQISVVIYKGNSYDLGAACGKHFAVGSLTVKEPGDSDILELAKEPDEVQAASESGIEAL